MNLRNDPIASAYHPPAPAPEHSQLVGIDSSRQRTPTSSHKFYGFQSLPPEIRVKIWKLAYDMKKPGDEYIGSSTNGRATTGDALKTEVQRYSGHAARQLCRTFNEEILDLVFEANGFEFFHTSVFLEFMNWAGARARSWLRKLRLHFSLKTAVIASKRSADTACQGLRYLSSCTRLEKLEIFARVIPEKVKSCWFSFELLNAHTIILKNIGNDNMTIEFGPEVLQRRPDDRPYAHLMNSVGKTERDNSMIKSTKEMVAEAIERVTIEFAATSQPVSSTFANIQQGKPQKWKGLAPKEKARKAKEAREAAKKRRRANQDREADVLENMRERSGNAKRPPIPEQAPKLKFTSTFLGWQDPSGHVFAFDADAQWRVNLNYVPMWPQLGYAPTQEPYRPFTSSSLTLGGSAAPPGDASMEALINP